MHTTLLKAQSPAALAEEYIVKSIWNHHFPAGSDLPAERELAERIGVTRTTLREVLQRLARDGWLHIQHGKPTRVNDIWETAGPNILGTMLKLDPQSAQLIISNVLSLRNRMAEYYVYEAIKHSPQRVLPLFEPLEQLEESSEAFALFDYSFYRQMTFIANKPVYALIYNSFKQTYLQVASLFFEKTEARQASRVFYHELKTLCEEGNAHQVLECLARNRENSTLRWSEILETLPESFTDK